MAGRTAHEAGEGIAMPSFEELPRYDLKVAKRCTMFWKLGKKTPLGNLLAMKERREGQRRDNDTALLASDGAS